MAKTTDERELLRFVGLSDSKQTTKLEQLRETITADEDFRFSRIKLDSKKTRFELPAPTRDDPDNTEIVKTFQAVVILAKKNFYRSDEDKEAGKEAKEKRALYLIRLGRFAPELLYVSPTALANWKKLCKAVSELKGDTPYFGVLVNVSAELIQGKQYTWTKPLFAVERKLTADELAHVEDMRLIVDERLAQWEVDTELDSYEEKALAVDKGKAADDDDDIDEADNSSKERKSRRAEIEDDEDDTPAAPAKNGKKKSKASDEDDDDEKPAKKSKSKAPDEDDDDDEKPAKKSKASEEEDDDDEKPAKKSKSKKSDEDDDDDEKPAKKKSEKKAGYPSLDDDDED